MRKEKEDERKEKATLIKSRGPHLADDEEQTAGKMKKYCEYLESLDPSKILPPKRKEEEEGKFPPPCTAYSGMGTHVQFSVKWEDELVPTPV